jgi:hypothetical protein
MGPCSLVGVVVAAALARPEVLCERVAFVRPAPGRPYATFPHQEPKEAAGRGAVYGLSSVTVTDLGWTVSAVAVYVAPAAPEKWSRLAEARLNVVRKKGPVPEPGDDPTKGELARVRVREHSPGAYEVRADGLKLELAPGEYWIGLTPVSDRTAHGQAGHVVVGDVRDARFDDAVRSPDAGGGALPLLRSWVSLGPRIYRPLGEHLSIRVEGVRHRHGRRVTWPAAPTDPAAGKSLHLRFAAFDPLKDPPAVPPELAGDADGLWVAQAKGTVDAAFRAALVRHGATVHDYLPDDAFLVALPAAAVGAVRDLPGVRWVGPYHPAYKLDPNLTPEAFVEPSVALRVPAGEAEGFRNVVVLLADPGAAGKAAAAAAVRKAGGAVVFASERGRYLAANVPRAGLAEVARCPAVVAVERRLGGFTGQSAADPPAKSPPALTMAQVRALCGADVLARAGYEGLGVRVGFWDDGVRADHVDLLARPLTVVGPQPRANANHGTAVAAILCGEGRGDPRARGLLPLGGLVFAPWGGGTDPQDGYPVIETFVREHRAALMSSSSGWGGVHQVVHYDGYAHLLDDLVAGYDVLFCQAVGNGSPGKGLCGSWAKNTLAVGGVHPNGSTDRADHRPLRATTGPAPDGRVKPDVVHLGFGVLTAHAGGPREYEPFAGTSCATPLAAGVAGLVTELWADGALGRLPLGKTVFDRKPHPATVKALLANAAYRYPAGGAANAFTRFQQGWGMPDVGRLYASRDRLLVVDEDDAVGGGEATEYRVRVADGEPELRVTLAYTDPPALTAAAKALVNDLDLIVIGPDGRRFLGNVGLDAANESAPGGTPDRANNVENVFVPRPAAGTWRVVVAAHRVAADQHRRAARPTQAYGLVVAGGRAEGPPR